MYKYVKIIFKLLCFVAAMLTVLDWKPSGRDSIQAAGCPISSSSTPVKRIENGGVESYSRGIFWCDCSHSSRDYFPRVQIKNLTQVHL